MHTKYIAVAEILIDIEKELRELCLWESTSPSPEALASVEPFAIDTLNFPQWLQFIFIPRLYFIIEQHALLPNNCAVAPMAEQYFQALTMHSTAIIVHLHKIDAELTGH